MKRLEILLVEDNPGDVRLTQEALSEARVDSELRVARDGVEAIDYLTETQDNTGDGGEPKAMPDLVLLDLNLPRKNGFEVLRWIKEHGVLKSIPVIVLTTSSAERDIQETYAQHVNSYVTKPVDFDGFVKVISEISKFWFETSRLPTRISGS